MTVRWLVCIAAVGVSLTASVCPAADDTVDYEKQIKPLLRERCFTCHGALKQEAELRLDTAGLMRKGGDSGAAITPGDPASSILLERVAAADPGDRMPPEHEGEPLSREQVKLIRDWIAMGAPSPDDEQPEEDARDHWAFRPVVRPAVPVVSNSAWVRNPIDAFLAEQHEQHGLTPQAEAARIVLLRRLSLDLIGIPPTSDEIAIAESDQSPGWYERTANRLLNDPRRGERWARHWMDVWRYSDWWGLGKQLRRSQKHIWHWRDWIVESVNNDTPYDEMLQLMLAADESHPNDLDKLRATGYLARNYWLFNRDQWMDETVEHLSKGVLGLTMNCAKCHDHKYDPFEQADYYRMRAFFEPYHVRLDILPGQPNLVRDGIPRVFDGVNDKPTYLYVRGQESNPDKSTVIAPGVPEIVAFNELDVASIALPEDAWQPERRPWIIETHLNAAREEIRKAEAAVVRSQKKLANAEAADKKKDNPGGGQPESTQETTASESKVTERQQVLKVAEASAKAAMAQLESIERRADAMREAWRVTDISSSDASNSESQTPADTDREKTVVAIRAERKFNLAKAEHELADAELELMRAKDAKKAAAKKRVKTARESLDKAVACADDEIKETDKYTELVGAKWTPTRFGFSGKDDAPVTFPPKSTGRRTALAKWITDRRNPLTARVASNHIWTRHMGEPLVATMFDFGRNGARPTNPELLDWLAAELMDSGWSMKHLHRLIVMSAAYRMSSSQAEAESNAEIDPDNRYWWRRVPIRLESQLLRDSILAHADSIDFTMYGPTIHKTKQNASKRRSLYFFHSNNERNLFLTTFDEALVTECYRRDQSVVPQQSLALSNSKLVLDAAPQIAKRLSTGTADAAAFIRTAFAVLVGIQASEKEIAASNKALKLWRSLKGDSQENARAHFVWALINHNDFVTLR